MVFLGLNGSKMTDYNHFFSRLFGELDLNAYFCNKHVTIMNLYPTNSIVRKESNFDICLVMFGLESKPVLAILRTIYGMNLK